MVYIHMPKWNGYSGISTQFYQLQVAKSNADNRPHYHTQNENKTKKIRFGTKIACVCSLKKPTYTVPVRRNVKGMKHNFIWKNKHHNLHLKTICFISKVKLD